jgi:hypothetical protein
MSAAEHYIITRGNDAGARFISLIFRPGAEQLYVTWYTTGALINTPTGVCPVDNNWHHVAFTVNRILKRVDLYFDGKPVSFVYSNAITDNFDTASPSIKLGCNGVFGNQWAGNMADVAFWNRPLAPQEVERLYRKALPQPSYTAYYNNVTALMPYSESRIDLERINDDDLDVSAIRKSTRKQTGHYRFRMSRGVFVTGTTLPNEVTDIAGGDSDFSQTESGAIFYTAETDVRTFPSLIQRGPFVFSTKTYSGKGAKGLSYKTDTFYPNYFDCFMIIPEFGTNWEKGVMVIGSVIGLPMYLQNQIYNTDVTAGFRTDYAAEGGSSLPQSGWRYMTLAQDNPLSKNHLRVYSLPPTRLYAWGITGGSPYNFLRNQYCINRHFFSSYGVNAENSLAETALGDTNFVFAGPGSLVFGTESGGGATPGKKGAPAGAYVSPIFVGGLAITSDGVYFAFTRNNMQKKA